MDIAESINKFYYDMALNELRLMSKKNYPNISYKSLLYLDVISYKENCTVSMLADTLNVTKSAVVIKVNEMVRRGLLRKTRSETDRRVYYLSLSDEAMQVFKDYDRMANKAAALITEKYNEEQINIFCEILELFGECCMENNSP